MGAGVSVPELLNEEDCRLLAERAGVPAPFDAARFSSLADEDGLVTRQQLIPDYATATAALAGVGAVCDPKVCIISARGAMLAITSHHLSFFFFFFFFFFFSSSSFTSSFCSPLSRSRCHLRRYCFKSSWVRWTRPWQPGSRRLSSTGPAPTTSTPSCATPRRPSSTPRRPGSGPPSGEGGGRNG